MDMNRLKSIFFILSAVLITSENFAHSSSSAAPQTPKELADKNPIVAGDALKAGCTLAGSFEELRSEAQKLRALLSEDSQKFYTKFQDNFSRYQSAINSLSEAQKAPISAAFSERVTKKIEQQRAETQKLASYYNAGFVCKNYPRFERFEAILQEQVALFNEYFPAASRDNSLCKRASPEDISREKERLIAYVSSGNQKLPVLEQQYRALETAHMAALRASNPGIEKPDNPMRGEYLRTVQPARTQWLNSLSRQYSALDRGYICEDRQGYEIIVQAYMNLFAKYSSSKDTLLNSGAVKDKRKPREFAAPTQQSRIAESTDPMAALRDALKNNRGEKFNELIQLMKPQRLDLSNLGLESLPVWFNLVDLRTVTTLDLSNNELRNLAGLERMTNLENLDVSNNKLTSLKGIHNLQNVIRIKASYNILGQYTTLNPNQVSRLPYLPVSIQILILDDNGFTGYLPKFDSQNLRQLAINNNPGLSKVCGYDQGNTSWPFIPLINERSLERFEIKNAPQLDNVSKICVRRISEKRTQLGNPIRILMD